MSSGLHSFVPVLEGHNYQQWYPQMISYLMHTGTSKVFKKVSPIKKYMKRAYEKDLKSAKDEEAKAKVTPYTEADILPYLEPVSGFAPFRVSPFGCSCSFRTSFPLRLPSCTLGLVLTTSASTVSSASSVLALLLIGFPNPFLSYLALLSYRLSIYSLDDGRTRDPKS
jgi:hypothetical protein